VNLEEVFEKFDDDYLKHDEIEVDSDPAFALTKRSDIRAFLILDRLFPGSSDDIVTAAEHDEIWLDVDVEELAKVATEADIRNLVRCGVCYDTGHEGLRLNV
jgi:hypothetical protein